MTAAGETTRDEVAAEIEAAIAERDRANTAARAALEAEQAARAAETAAAPHIAEQQRVAKEQREERYRRAWVQAQKDHAEGEADFKRAVGEGDLAVAGPAFVRWHRAQAVENFCSETLTGRLLYRAPPNFIEWIGLLLGKLPGTLDPFPDE